MDNYSTEQRADTHSKMQLIGVILKFLLVSFFVYTTTKSDNEITLAGCTPECSHLEVCFIFSFQVQSLFSSLGDQCLHHQYGTLSTYEEQFGQTYSLLLQKQEKEASMRDKSIEAEI